MYRKHPLSISVLSLVFLLGLVAPAAHATSARGTVNANNSRVYGFTMPSDGGVEITLTWNQNHEDLFLLMSCTDGFDTLDFSSIATEGRVARLDVGVIGGLDCAVGVFSFQRPGTFTMAVSVSARGPGLRALSAGGSFAMTELTGEEAQAMGLRELEQKVRSLRK